jgi:PAS domain-containing protein
MAAPSALTPSSDASYLRRLLERQPACLIRVRLDGVLLACNDAALSLFGVGALRAVLNTNLTDRIVPTQRTRWQEFATRCWANGAASLECHLVIPDDNVRPVLVQGVALKDHPDGVESLLLNLRDQSQTHRLSTRSETPRSTVWATKNVSERLAIKPKRPWLNGRSSRCWPTRIMPSVGG